MKKHSFISYFMLFLISGLSFFTSCDKTEENPFKDDILLGKLYGSAVDTLSLDAGKYILQPILYRDFFPGVPFSGKRLLTAVIDIVNIDSLPVSDALEIKNLYVIKDRTIWRSVPKMHEDTCLPYYILRLTSIDGPEWEINIHVDVIVEIEEKENNKNYFLISRDQRIEKIE